MRPVVNCNRTTPTPSAGTVEKLDTFLGAAEHLLATEVDMGREVEDEAEEATDLEAGMVPEEEVSLTSTLHQLMSLQCRPTIRLQLPSTSRLLPKGKDNIHNDGASNPGSHGGCRTRSSGSRYRDSRSVSWWTQVPGIPP